MWTQVCPQKVHLVMMNTRDWGDVLISQGKPKMAAKLDERLGADSVTQPSGENNLTNTLISDF